MSLPSRRVLQDMPAGVRGRRVPRLEVAGVAGGRRRLELVHRITDRLSEAGWRILAEGFEKRARYREIGERLRAIGEPVSERTIGRRAAEWRGVQRREAALEELRAHRELLATGLWRIEELVNLIDELDFLPGWWLRYSRKLNRALVAFLKAPSGDRMRAIQHMLILFWLATLVSAVQEGGPSGVSKGAK